MYKSENQRIAWLLPAMGTGGISFQHILCEFTRKFPQTIVFTGQWPGFATGFENTFKVQKVGTTKHIPLGWSSNGYGSSISLMSPSIMGHLLKFKPQVIFANAFSMWTAMALLLKPLTGWKVIIICEGVSPNIDYRGSPVRLASRHLIVRLADAFVVNSKAAKAYLVNVLGAREDRVFARPFLVPSQQAMLQYRDDEVIKVASHLQQPIFLFVGQIIPRKGLKVLLKACSSLKLQGYQDFTLLVVGDGEQRQELEDFAKSMGLSTQVRWLGRVEYWCLGQYFQAADVFVFPTYEDIWGMVLTEAMAFGKPVLCSKGAGAVEMVNDKENGFIFDPSQPEELAKYMRCFIDNSDLISAMNEESRQIMTNHTPEQAVKCFVEAFEFVESSIT